MSSWTRNARRLTERPRHHEIGGLADPGGPSPAIGADGCCDGKHRHRKSNHGAVAVKSVKFLILGAGPTGLGAAWRLSELSVADWLLLEAASQPGGLAASFMD